ncbi:MAG TPA: polyphosphate kinase 2, partial [Hyphomicrobiaceae bacterium]|nr:polyphosphate kinase 2 [Hyphomicrobiaceae bacterium]
MKSRREPASKQDRTTPEAAPEPARELPSADRQDAAKSGAASRSPDADGTTLQQHEPPAHKLSEMRHDRDAIRRIFETGEYPYKRKIDRRSYEARKAELQIELLKVQEWVKDTGAKVVLIFEGRDAAGKGGTIKRFTEHLNPRGARVVALDKPTEREKTQWFFQRYIQHLPSGGEIVMFD